MRIRKLCKTYQVAERRLEVLRSLDLDVDDHGITVVLGRSGCGKTTLLRLVAGLEQADSGTVEPWVGAGNGESTEDGKGKEGGESRKNGGSREDRENEENEESRENRENEENGESRENRENEENEESRENRENEENRESRRNGDTREGKPGCLPKMGVIFQEPRLMPWLTIGDNILFGTGRRMRKKGLEDTQLNHLLELTSLKGFEKAYPSQLSGGMQQRAALARALAYEPDYLLMDEPFAALDYFTRRQMQQELLRIYETEKKGILFVTHSIDEALTIGGKVVILENGVCRREYDLNGISYPRDLFSQEMFGIRRDIIKEIEKGGKEDET